MSMDYQPTLSGGVILSTIEKAIVQVLSLGTCEANALLAQVERLLDSTVSRQDWRSALLALERAGCTVRKVIRDEDESTAIEIHFSLFHNEEPQGNV